MSRKVMNKQIVIIIFHQLIKHRKMFWDKLYFVPNCAPELSDMPEKSSLLYLIDYNKSTSAS